MAKGFFKGVKSELGKVVWPTKNQLVNNTVLVVLLIVAFAVIILGFDVILDLVDTKIWNVIGSKIG